MLIVPTIAVPLGNRQRDAVSLPYLRGLKLAHPLTGEDIFSISLLIGADKYWDIVGNRVIRGDGPTAVQSKIGYLFSGPLPTPTTETALDCLMNMITSPQDTKDQERFGKLETLDIQPEKDDESSEYLATYQRKWNVFKNGRYSAQSPWKPYRVPDPPSLPKIRVLDAPGFRVTILELLTGNDGLTRAATLQTSSGLITSRPIVKIYPLEILLAFSSWRGGCRYDNDHTWREPRRCIQGANVDVMLRHSGKR